MKENEPPVPFYKVDATVESELALMSFLSFSDNLL